RAPGRQINGGRGQLERIAISGKARHKATGQEGISQRRQKRLAGRNGEDARRRAAGHDPPWRAIAASAAATASGVLTVIQWPRTETPNHRPAAMARSK